MKELKKIIVLRLMLAMLLLCSAVLGIAGCFHKPAVSSGIQTFQTFRDIPGITAEEISAIEVLQKKYASFSYGMFSSTETFAKEDGTVGGYSALFCEWLSGLFDIPFEAEIHTSSEVLVKVDNGEIDFTGGVMPTEEREKNYFLTDPIAERKFSMIRVKDSPSLDKVALPRYAYASASPVGAAIASLLEEGTYETVLAHDYMEAYEIIKSNKADAYVATNIVESVFIGYDDIIIEDFYPLIFNPVAMAASKTRPELEVIISAVNKALRNGASRHLQELYKQGYRDYQKYAISAGLTDEERSFIAANPVVPVAAFTINYPLCFHNVREDEWQGIYFDILNEVSALTGLSFVVGHDRETPWLDVRERFFRGEMALVPELSQSAEWREILVWSNTKLTEDYYALISRLEHPNITLNEIPHIKVGMAQGTSHARMFKQWFPHHSNCVEYADIETAFNALIKGDVDMVMSSQRRLMYLTVFQEQPYYKANITFNQYIETRLTAHKDYAVLMGIIDKVLKLTNTEEIVSRWSQRTYDYRAKVAEAQRPWLIGAIVLSLVVLVLILIMFFRSRMVSARLSGLLEEKKQAEETLKRSEMFLRTLNDMAVILLSHENEAFENVMSRGIKPIAEATGVERVSVYVRLTERSDFAVRQIYLWIENTVPLDLDVIVVPEVPATQRWHDTLSSGGCLNQDVSKVTKVEEAFYNQFGVKAVCFVPIFIKGEYWGIIAFGDHTNYRCFSEDEVNLMRSAAHLCAFALARNDMMQHIINRDKELQNILDTMLVGVTIAGKDDGKLIYANKAAMDIFNCKDFERELAGRSVLEFMPEFQPNGRRTVDMAGEFLRQENISMNFQYIKLSGELFIARITQSNVHFEGKLSSLATIVDLTEEEKYKNELITARELAEQSNRYKTDFLARMSHEIRTPMNAIIGMTELALRENEADAKDEHMVTVKQAGTHLLAIINDILDFSKIEAGKIEIVTGEYSAAYLLNDLVSIIRMKMVDSQVRFVVKADSRIPHTLFGDETRIRQTILNILSNAVKYTEKGFISLDVNAEFADNKKVNIIFTVTDSGRGIKQEDMNKLFSDFTQFDIEKNRNIEGVGLGLAITKNIVEAMGGVITAESEYGAGSIFTVTLPQKYDTRDAFAKVEPGKINKVLIYERRDIYAESLVYTIENLKQDCTLVSSGTELYEKMESGNYDYLFISFPLFMKNEDTILKFKKNTKTVILAEFGETIPEKYTDVLTMPVYCTQIANLFNGVYDDLSNNVKNESIIRFSAPDAKVLIVDDINTNLKIAEGLLAPYNMRVDLRSSGKAAIEALQGAKDSGEQYDLVFMDHKMPGMDGVEATKRIREWEKELPIIALTANAVSGMMEMFIENGFNDFLSKPINTIQLNSILEKWIPKGKQFTPPPPK